MAIFSTRFFKGSKPTSTGVEDYRAALSAAPEHQEVEAALIRELVAITTTITDGIRDVIQKERHIRQMVLVEGALPLGTWAESLDEAARKSLEALKRRIEEMERDLERGRIAGFPATMLLHHKPIFTTFRPFYNVVFSFRKKP